MANKAHTAYQLLNVGASLGGVDVCHTSEKIPTVFHIFKSLLVTF